MKQKKRKTTEKETRHQRRHSRFASLFEGEMQQILTERHSAKTKQMTKVSLNFSVLKLLNVKLEFSTENLK